jgi:hypothetical protein
MLSYVYICLARLTKNDDPAVRVYTIIKDGLTSNGRKYTTDFKYFLASMIVFVLK